MTECSAWKIDAMYFFCGKGSGKCGECPHFLEGYYHDKKYFKCLAYGCSHSEATDWRKKWVACGLIGKPLPEDERPVKERISHVKRSEPEWIDGQMTMEELLQINE